MVDGLMALPPIALLPYCLTALLPYCPIALLPYCRMATWDMRGETLPTLPILPWKIPELFQSEG